MGSNGGEGGGGEVGDFDCVTLNFSWSFLRPYSIPMVPSPHWLLILPPVYSVSNNWSPAFPPVDHVIPKSFDPSPPLTVIEKNELFSTSLYFQIFAGCETTSLLLWTYIDQCSYTSVFFTLGFLSEAISFLVLGYFSNATTVAVLITIGVGLGGLARSGFYVNHLDIASPLASVLLGITNTAASSAGILAPIVTGLIVQHHVSLVFKIVHLISRRGSFECSFCFSIFISKFVWRN